ncbi:CrfX protein [Pseudomonas sp. C27(2019)]|uniref:CrfX protein n=1 Tax=Pseudomonas sp. C27(2019) TaxID=2604941 RepID=UPI001245B77D|nr:CrfX protein [Pseudomonas sp. C27(2019)]QEY58490.1 CrfX protein [Pseudomonas sp. C27(2019)]
MNEDPFEQSLRDMLKAPETLGSDDVSLDRVLKKANRQQGAGAIFGLFGRALESVLIGINNGSEHLKPISNLSDKHTANKAD